MFNFYKILKMLLQVKKKYYYAFIALIFIIYLFDKNKYFKDNVYKFNVNS